MAYLTKQCLNCITDLIGPSGRRYVLAGLAQPGRHNPALAHARRAHRGPCFVIMAEVCI